jgi:hypothetical protein
MDCPSIDFGGLRAPGILQVRWIGLQVAHMRPGWWCADDWRQVPKTPPRPGNVDTGRALGTPEKVVFEVAQPRQGPDSIERSTG